MNDPLLAHAERSISVGSKSFGAAARLLPRESRRGALMLYAWCRHCDDTIDDQSLGHSIQQDTSPVLARARLATLRHETERAFAGEAMSHPAFAAFQDVINRFQIPKQFALDHLAGYEMDVESYRYESLDETLCYCYRVAGVVGLMMGSVLNVRAPDDLDRACDLGIAFQLTNIARDILDDATVGRCYVPRDWLEAEGMTVSSILNPRYRPELARIAARLVATAEPYYASARVGLSAMSIRSAWAIAAAHNVYREIGIKVIKRGPMAWNERVSTTQAEKATLVARAGREALGSRLARRQARSPTLWDRPDR